MNMYKKKHVFFLSVQETNKKMSTTNMVLVGVGILLLLAMLGGGGYAGYRRMDRQ
jgi:hypothetical protein